MGPSRNWAKIHTRMMEVAVFTVARILPMPSAATGYAALLSSAGPRISAAGWKGFADALRACSTASAMAAMTCDATCFTRSKLASDRVPHSDTSCSGCL
jgi:hypothetical protein